ncbi:MAG: hypothetical protein ACRDNE_01835 [Gaiellaceae bacterium]
MSPSTMKTLFYKLSYSRWQRPRSALPGYSLLLPVPADLPVFLKVALSVCRAQERDHRVETIVIPDRRSPEFARLFRALRSEWDGEPLRVAQLGHLGTMLSRTVASAHTRHWLQIVHGINASRSTHALLHDADLFLSDPSFLRTHFEQGAGRACFGVSDVWDDWYRENGFRHVVATWELLFDLSWATGFEPWVHRGHDDVLDGKAHTFDTMLLPQCLTGPELVGRRDDNQGFIHFNYVVCAYRSFQRRSGPFEDQGFSLLLIRLLVAAYEMSRWCHDLPSLPRLVAGLRDATAPVTYRAPETRAKYETFRSKLDALIASGLLPTKGVETVARSIEPFDAALA